MRGEAAAQRVWWKKGSSWAAERLPASTSHRASAIVVAAAAVDGRSFRMRARWSVRSCSSGRWNVARIGLVMVGYIGVSRELGQAGLPAGHQPLLRRGPRTWKDRPKAVAQRREYRTERSEGGTDRSWRVRGGATLGGTGRHYHGEGKGRVSRRVSYGCYPVLTRTPCPSDRLRLRSIKCSRISSLRNGYGHS